MFICEYFRHHNRVKHNRSQLIVCLTLESKVLQERIHKQHLCAKQKNNKSAQFAEFTVTNASIVKAEKVIQIRKCVTLK